MLGPVLTWKAFFAQKLQEFSLTDQRGRFDRARIVEFIGQQRRHFRDSLSPSQTEFHHGLQPGEVTATAEATAKRARTGARPGSLFHSAGSISKPAASAAGWLRAGGDRTVPLDLARPQPTPAPGVAAPCGDGSASHGAVEDYRIVLLMLYIDQLGLKALFFPNLNRHLMVVMKLIENTL